MKALTKTEIYRDMMEICKDSRFLHQNKIEDPWKMNLLIYCLEKLDYDYNIHVDIHTEEGEFIPVRRTGGIPVFMPASYRNKMVKIVNIESYFLDNDDPEKGYVYLLIIEEKANEEV